ncbi:hypothetical protein FTUN_8324 [Frigoriglobus tundricola]|uniref:Uncharacterized protein n=1 Tax=Frigoriglobus tundricola TaxID=2774151 RepID=A0A6M5Z574_9BACT|nr:hypothetical protein FTUN_8324 [Frigoriglobus tundricola]
MNRRAVRVRPLGPRPARPPAVPDVMLVVISLDIRLWH